MSKPRSPGARPVLVPTERTLPEEILNAPEVAATFAEAVETLLGAAAALPSPDTAAAACSLTPMRPQLAPLREAIA